MRPAVGSWRPDGAATNRGAMAARSKKPTGGRRQAIDADAVVAEYAAWLGRQPLAGRSRDAYLVHRARRPVPGRLHVPLVVPHRSVPDAGLHQGRSAAFGAGQPGEEAAHLGHRPWRPSTASTAQSASADRRWPGRSWPGSRPGHWRRPTSGGSCERSRAARRRGTGRSPRCSSTPGYVSPSWLPSRWAICRSRPAGVGCGFARGRATPTREVPLNSVCRHAIDEWTTARTDQVAADAATSSPPAASAALWLSRSESRISARVIDLIIRRLAKDAHLELSAHTLLEGPSMTAVGTSHRARRGRPAAAEVRPAGLRHLLAVVVAGARCGRGGRLGPGGRPAHTGRQRPQPHRAPATTT